MSYVGQNSSAEQAQNGFAANINKHVLAFPHEAIIILPGEMSPCSFILSNGLDSFFCSALGLNNLTPLNKISSCNEILPSN